MYFDYVVFRVNIVNVKIFALEIIEQKRSLFSLVRSRASSISGFNVTIVYSFTFCTYQCTCSLKAHSHCQCYSA